MIDLSPLGEIRAGRPGGREWLTGGQPFNDAEREPVMVFDGERQGLHVPDRTAPAAARFTGIPLGVYAAAVRAGAADPGRTQIPPGLQAGALWKTLLGDRPPDGDPRLAGIMLSAWVSVLGYLAAEIFGSLAELISDPGEFYQAHIRAVMLGMGFQPALVQQAAAGET